MVGRRCAIVSVNVASAKTAPSRGRRSENAMNTITNDNYNMNEGILVIWFSREKNKKPFIDQIGSEMFSLFWLQRQRETCMLYEIANFSITITRWTLFMLVKLSNQRLPSMQCDCPSITQLEFNSASLPSVCSLRVLLLAAHFHSQRN